MTDPTEPTVWVVRAGERGRLAEDVEQAGVAAISFHPVGDLTGCDRDAIRGLSREAFGSKGPNVAGQLHNFANVIKAGDLIVMPVGSSRTLSYGWVTGTYSYTPEAIVEDLHHTRAVDWMGARDRDPLPDRVLYSLGSLLTVFKPRNPEVLSRYLIDGVIDETSAAETGEQAGDDESDEASASEHSARSRLLIEERIAALGWLEAQSMAAGVLESLGYSTNESPPGADGGIDVVACRDPLFLHPPIVKVQVKAKPDQKSGPDDIRQLNGVLRKDERGIFVSTGGFSRTAEAEANQMGVILWDLSQLTELFVENYHSLPEAVQTMVPLRRIWVVDDQSAD